MGSYKSKQPHSSPLWLNLLPVLVQVGEQLIIALVEEMPGQLRQLGVNVTRAGRILPSLSPGAKHSTRVQQVDVVAADKVLRHTHDGPGQAGLSVVVGGIVGNVSRKVADLSLGH